MKKQSYEIDMCHGPLLGKILLFSLPLMLSSILQLLFNAADMIVVGRYAGSQALAAVGATGALINLLINVFMGLSVGVNVMVARYYGGKKEEAVSETVHTAVLTSLISGVILTVLGITLCHPLLALMGTPEDVIDQSTVYMRIYFAGMPVIMLYNFGSSILRAIGDTKRPLYFLTLAGVVNVILNLFFVIVLHMGVAGVATATVLSQCISAFLILLCLMRSDGCFRLYLKKLRFHWKRLAPIMQIGLPAGLQGAIFSLSNVLIQSSVNSFGSVVMAGNTAAANIEGFVYVAMNAFHQTALSFTSQNFGARNFDRIKKIFLLCVLCVTVTGLLLGIGAWLFGAPLLGIYTDNPEVVKFGMLRLSIICTTYFTCGIMDVMVGFLRGVGSSIMPMIVSLAGACGLRIIWIFTIFQWNRTMTTLYISYPVSWTLTASVHMICFFILFGKLQKTHAV